MKIVYLLLLSLILIFSFSACDCDPIPVTESNLSVGENQNPPDTDKYIIQTPYYQIIELDTQKYKYRIATGDHVLVEDIKSGTAPKIEDKGDGVLKLHLGYGTNAFTVKYFDVHEKKTSKEFYPYTIYADYVDKFANEYYFAYFKMEQNPKLYIDGFFDCSEFSIELDLDFAMPNCKDIIFLNESEIYIEYTNTQSEDVRRVINFKEINNKK